MKLKLEKSSTDGYIIVILGYARSSFRAFESYFRNLVGLDDDDIQLISKQFISHPQVKPYQFKPQTLKHVRVIKVSDKPTYDTSLERS